MSGLKYVFSRSKTNSQFMTLPFLPQLLVMPQVIGTSAIHSALYITVGKKAVQARNSFSTNEVHSIVSYCSLLQATQTKMLCIFFFLIFYFLSEEPYMFMCLRTTWENCFSVDSGVELRSSDFVIYTFTYWAILLVPIFFLLKFSNIFTVCLWQRDTSQHEFAM